MNEFNIIVERMFGMRAADVKDSMTPKDIPEWDSMNYLLFIAELEKAYDTTFTMNEVMQARELGDLRRILQARGKSA